MAVLRADCGNNNGGCRDGRACTLFAKSLPADTDRLFLPVLLARAGSIEAGLRVCGPCGEESESFLDGCRSAPSWKVTSGLIAGILAALVRA